MKIQPATPVKHHRLALACAALLSAGLLLTAMPAAAQEKIIRTKPVEYTNPSSGAEMFAKYCAACHGIQGNGNGPAASALKRPPSDLTQLAKRNKGKYPGYYVLTTLRYGGRVHKENAVNMPVWKDRFHFLDSAHSGVESLRLKNLTDHVERLQEK